jgi:hypothetical protein
MLSVLVKIFTVLPALFEVKSALKEGNLKAKSTGLSVVPLLGAIAGPDAVGMAPDSLESILTRVVLTGVAVIMFFLKAKAAEGPE